MKRSDRPVTAGVAVFSVVAFVVLTVVVVMAFSQRYRSGVVSQRETIAVGRRALYLAESAINEALLDFTRGMNDPAGSVAGCYGILRSSFAAGDHFNYSFFPGYAQEHCTSSDGEAHVEDVQVDVWALQPLNDLAYERCGLLTITAVVAIPRRTGIFNRYIYRNVQRSYELKQVQVTAPQPFGDYALFLLKWDYLTRALGDYLSDQDPFDQRRQAAQTALQKLQDDMKLFLNIRIPLAEDGIDKLRDAQDQIPPYRFPCPLHPPLPLKPCCPANHGWSAADIEAAVESVLQEVNLTVAAVEDIAATDPEVLQPPELAAVSWPPFRADMNLTNPVVVHGTVSSSDYPFRFPSWPSLPAAPVVPAPWHTTWEFPGLGNLIALFETYATNYDSSVAQTHAQNWQTELTRHEGKFELLGGVPGSYSLLGPRYQYRRASWRFKDSGSMAAFVAASGKLRGGYWVSGDASLGGPYQGMGTVACSGSATVNGGSAGGDSLLTVYAAHDIDAGGSVGAALFAPDGTVHGGPVRGLVVENYLSDLLDVTNDPSYQAGGADGSRQVVTVSPYPVATNFLRRAN